jgi:SAM-dependent methyltransferase
MASEAAAAVEQHDGERFAHRGSIDKLLRFDRFHATLHAEIVDWLGVPPGGRILDAGCGAGGVTALLAQATGAAGAVAALDLAPEHLEATRRVVDAAGFGDRLSLHEGRIESLPFPDGAFDLVWCSRAVHGLPDQLAGVRELRRVLRPGGRLALREGGLSPRFLPQDIGLGEPGLEERLAALHQRWFWQWRRSMPGAVSYPFGWSRMLADAGLGEMTVRSFLLERLPPFDEEDGEHVVEQLRGRLEHAEIGAWLTDEDRTTLTAITDPDDPHFLLRRPDLHALSVISVYVGTA